MSLLCSLRQARCGFMFFLEGARRVIWDLHCHLNGVPDVRRMSKWRD